MLSYVARSLWRNPRRAFAAIAGVALAAALFADAAFFVDGSGKRMTSRAIAHVTIDMQAGINAPLASPLSLEATVSPRPPLALGQPVTITVVAKNSAPVPTSGVVLDARIPARLGYRLGSTKRDGSPVADVAPSDESPLPSSPLAAGFPLGTLAPGASTTVSYSAAVLAPVSSAADLLESTIRSVEEPAPTPPNGPRAVDLRALAADVRRVSDVRAAQPFALVDLPAGSVRIGARAIGAPIKLIGLDPAYAKDLPIVRFDGTGYRPGTALLSPAAAEQLGAASGALLQLQLPGRPSTAPLTIPFGALADLTHADQLFANRQERSLGDFVAAPYVVGVDIETFQRQVLPALRVDAAAAVPIVKVPPVLEVHTRIARAALATDPSSAFRATSGVRRGIERAAPGDVTVIDNASNSLDKARTDSTLAKVLFIALGLPGAVLAGYLAFYGGGLLAETERRERALLRARGFAPLRLARGLAYQAVAIAGIGAALGLAAALIAGRVLFPDEFTPRGSGFAISIALATLVSVVTTLFAVYLPARRAVLRDVTEGRRAIAASDRPGWLRARLDLLLLIVAGVVSVIFVVTGGFKPNPKAHDESIARSFYVLLAPWCLWIGGTLLAARGVFALSRRIGRTTVRQDFSRRLVWRTMVRSVARRPRAVVSGIIALSLAIAFGVSLAIFATTFRDQQRADAHFVTGSDVRVTPSLGTTPASDMTTRLRVPGVDAISPVAQDPDFVVGTEPLLFAGIDPRSFARVARLEPGFFADTTPAKAMVALARDPQAVLVDRETADSFNLQKGDTVKAQLPSPTLGRPVLVSLRVVGTFIQIPGFPLGLDFVGNLAHYQQETGRAAPTYYLLRTDGSERTNARVAGAIGTAFGTSAPVRVNTTTKTANKDQTSLAGLSLTGLARVESLYTLLIASLGIVIFVVALLVQRSSERAVMRALGLARRKVHAVILGEAGIVLAVSVVVGLAIGVPMAYMFVQILRRIFVVPPSSLSLPPSEVLVLVTLLLVTIGLSSALISGALRRMRLVELLREE